MGTKKNILIVDDEPNIRSSLELLLRETFQVETAEDGLMALEKIESRLPDLVLLDLVMPRMDGLETLKKIRKISGTVPVVLLTATNTVKSAVSAMKEGASDYLSKPFDIEELTETILNLLASVGQVDAVEEDLERDSEQVRGVEAPPADFGQMIGRSPAMVEVFNKVKQIAQHDSTVLITGESGTGKELVAKSIHELSPRNVGPFVAINCAAIPETLIESELFGHEKGAFTSAVEKRFGHFELADGGTLFLDEIGELGPSVQVKMLRFLQEQEFYRVGSSKPTRVNVRIVAATNKNLETLISEKKFREDLYYRINVINLELPALRDRFEDIPSLVEYFISKYSPVYGNKAIQLSGEAMETLVDYAWPGNVRELENVVESLMALSVDSEIQKEHLPKKIVSQRPLKPPQFSIFEPGMKFDEAEKLFETEMILKALRKADYVQTRAANILGISRRILKYKMDKLGISDKPEH